MKKLIALPGLLLIAACGASHDEGNDQVTLQYNEQAIEDAAADAQNTAQDVGATIVNEVQDTADKVQNTDVDVNVERTDGAEQTNQQ